MSSNNNTSGTNQSSVQNQLAQYRALMRARQSQEADPSAIPQAQVTSAPPAITQTQTQQPNPNSTAPVKQQENQSAFDPALEAANTAEAIEEVKQVETINNIASTTQQNQASVAPQMTEEQQRQYEQMLLAQAQMMPESILNTSQRESNGGVRPNDPQQMQQLIQEPTAAEMAQVEQAFIAEQQAMLREYERKQILKDLPPDAQQEAIQEANAPLLANQDGDLERPQLTAAELAAQQQQLREQHQQNQGGQNQEEIERSLQWKIPIIGRVYKRQMLVNLISLILIVITVCIIVFVPSYKNQDD